MTAPTMSPGAVRRVACPHCNATPGHPCKRPGGTTLPTGQHHDARKDAAARREGR